MAVLTYPPNLIFNAILLVVCVYAVVAGRGFTRLCAAAYLALAAGGKVTFFWFPEKAGDVELASNVALLGLFASRALRGGPAWTLFATAFQLVICGLWLVRGGVEWNTLVAAARIWEYLLLATLGSRAWQEARARSSVGRKAQGVAAGADRGPRAVGDERAF